MAYPLFRDAEDTKIWIDEKDAALSSEDYGKDLAGVQALQRKHEVIERDLAAVEEKVKFLILLIVSCQAYLNRTVFISNKRFC